jgi:anaerobic magnesium-protoporphyrin IX monomethyl ester cyclase
METERRVIQTDTRRWDYKHQVLATRHMPPWRVLLWVKFIEVVMQLRPRALGRFFFMRDPAIRRAQHWYYRIGRRVWPYEIFRFFFREPLTANGPTLAEFWGPPQEEEEESMLPRATGSLCTLEPLRPPAESREAVGAPR